MVELSVQDGERGPQFVHLTEQPGAVFFQQVYHVLGFIRAAAQVPDESLRIGDSQARVAQTDQEL